LGKRKKGWRRGSSYIEAAQVLATLPDAVASPADEVDVDLGAAVELLVLPVDVVDSEADAEDLGGEVAEGLDDFVDDGLELLEGRDQLDKLEKILLGSADLVGREVIIKDNNIIPSDTATDGQVGGVDIDDTADSAVGADIEALLPGTLVVHSGLVDNGFSLLSESNSSKDSKNTNNSLHFFSLEEEQKSRQEKKRMFTHKKGKKKKIKNKNDKKIVS